MNPKELGKMADKLQDELEAAKKKGDLKEMAEIIEKLKEIRVAREALQK